MIDINKKYQTRDGREVKIYAIYDVRGDYCVHGAVLAKNGWSSASWTSEGDYWGGDKNDLDLIEVKEKRVYERWVNVLNFGGFASTYLTKREADKDAPPSRIACIHIRQEYEEGEGL